jgi:hypothetical protein
MKPSPLAVANRAGMKLFDTCSIGDRFDRSKFAFYFIELETKERTGLTKKEGSFV